MGHIAHTAIVGFFAAVIAGIVFVRAGQRGGRSGGEQAADVIKAGSSGIAAVANGLES